MKNLLSLILVFTLSTIAFAQQEMMGDVEADQREMKAKNDAYMTVMENRLNVEFRNNTIEALSLDTEEATDFDLIYQAYLEDKESLTARRRVLVEEYREEMKEDDTAEDEENETADFIENYWEIDIAVMELKKDYFDRLEDKIGVSKALAFFAMEESYQNRIDRLRLFRAIPSLVTLEPGFVSYQRELDDYNDWNTVNIDGKVALDHEFTTTGLKKLLTAAEAMKNAEAITVTDFKMKKDKIMMKADAMQKNWKSLDHAEQARDAFTMTAEVLAEIARDSRFTARTPWIEKLGMTAKSIKSDVKLTDQSDTIYTFFDTAEMIVNDLVRQSGGIEMKMKEPKKRK